MLIVQSAQAVIFYSEKFMRILFLLTVAIFLVACQAVPIENVGTIKTKTALKSSISLPIDASVAFYVDKTKPGTSEINFFGLAEEAVQLVGESYFSNIEDLNADSEFDFLFRIKMISTWDHIWGGWDSVAELNVIDNQGRSFYSNNAKASSSGAGLYDIVAVKNSQAKAVKELINVFLNGSGLRKLNEFKASAANSEVSAVPVRSLLPDLKAETSGTALFINENGQLLSAAHVTDECLWLEVTHQGESMPAEEVASSQLLDLTVIAISQENTPHVSIQKDAARLGSQVFVSGYPLSNLLSEYPSLTIGNISSIGGLKGSKGNFQFSAPIQPGSSGGGIFDYNGNLVGIVSSTLNQKLLLEKEGVTAQNLNFGINADIVMRFLDENNITYDTNAAKDDFEIASEKAVAKTKQLLCYK